MVKNNGEQIEQFKQTLQNITQEQAKNEEERKQIILQLDGLNNIIDSRDEQIAEIQEDNSRLQNDYNEKQRQMQSNIDKIAVDLQIAHEDRDSALSEIEMKKRELDDIRGKIQETLRNFQDENEENQDIEELSARLDNDTTETIDDIINQLNRRISSNNENMQTLTRERDQQIVRIQELQQEQETNTADYDKIIEKLSALKTYLLRVIKHQSRAPTIPVPEGREVEIVSQLLGPQNVNKTEGTINLSEDQFTQKEQQDENTAENLGQQFAQDSDQGRTQQAASKLAFQPQSFATNQNILKVVDVNTVHKAIPMVLPSIYENKEIGDEQMMEIVNTLFLSEDSSDIMSGDQTALVGRKFHLLLLNLETQMLH